jgi:nicotinamide-nucleotide amidase
MIAEKLNDFENRLPENIGLAYLPSLGTVRLRLTARGENAKKIEQQVETLKTELISIIPNIVAGFDDDSMPIVIGKLLKEKNLTVACAESCTGGLLSHLITAVPGSSAYFLGSVISYNNSVKTKTLKVKKSTIDSFGAVSEETVKGVAGPSGGTKQKPVGTVWLAVGDAQNTITAKLGIDRGRAKNIEYAAHSALNLLRKFLLHQILS